MAARVVEQLARRALGTQHQLVRGRPAADRFRARGLRRKGTTTTPFDIVVRDRVSRYRLVLDALENARRTPTGASALKAWCMERLAAHHASVGDHLLDMSEVRDWVLPGKPDRPSPEW